jgi:hypothetical protein
MASISRTIKPGVVFRLFEEPCFHLTVDSCQLSCLSTSYFVNQVFVSSHLQQQVLSTTHLWLNSSCICIFICSSKLLHNILHDNHMISITYIPLNKNWPIYLTDLGGLMGVLYFIGYNKFITNKTVIIEVIHTIILVLNHCCRSSIASQRVENSACKPKRSILLAIFIKEALL